MLTEVSYPDLRDPALEQLDSPSASQIVWQVKVATFSQSPADSEDARRKAANDFVSNLSSSPFTGSLRVAPTANPDAMSSQTETDLCEMEIDERYRGVENQLYRVEIHTSGSAFFADSQIIDKDPCATFKFSRDNGSVTFPIMKWQNDAAIATVTLAHSGRDCDARFSLKAGDWVEYNDEITILRFDLAEPPDKRIFPTLLQVKSVNPYDPTLIVLQGAPKDLVPPNVPKKSTFTERRAFLRRWDQQPKQTTKQVTQPTQILDATEPIQSATTNGLLVAAQKDMNAIDKGWIEIENGIRIRFSPGQYNRGDYWLIPARFATGKVLWPSKLIDPQNPESRVIPDALPPRTIEHHFAPLAVVYDVAKATECRRIAKDLIPPQSVAEPAPAPVAPPAPDGGQ